MTSTNRDDQRQRKRRRTKTECENIFFDVLLNDKVKCKSVIELDDQGLIGFKRKYRASKADQSVTDKDRSFYDFNRADVLETDSYNNYLHSSRFHHNIDRHYSTCANMTFHNLFFTQPW
jgi:hypothetical protein